ncbi:hypothetical protein HELRODRAFT_173741 [Helobdella robusta]|uniref:Antistasin-like domain-containing protein n=1 Tax=Helobdella robusta TaxID=6412 RepID=T1F766_HELRO|nr:hypothetical protein HELRODRAFT_173741 [Helobdella robusta]ESO03445.1 hypothetical protein HELRODRAFT_173741 [Helobdella robusta]
MIGRFVAVATVALVLLVATSSAQDRVVCPSLNCPTACRYGYVPDDNGCRTCECLNACVNLKCGDNGTCAGFDKKNLDAVKCFPQAKLCCPCDRIYWPYNYVNYANCCPLGCKATSCPMGMICCPNKFGCLKLSTILQLVCQPQLSPTSHMMGSTHLALTFHHYS